MAEIGDITVTLRAKDEVTPVLKRIQRRLWWMRYGRDVAMFITGAVVGFVSFIVGYLAGNAGI